MAELLESFKALACMASTSVQGKFRHFRALPRILAQERPKARLPAAFGRANASSKFGVSRPTHNRAMSDTLSTLCEACCWTTSSVVFHSLLTTLNFGFIAEFGTQTHNPQAEKVSDCLKGTSRAIRPLNRCAVMQAC